MPKIKTFEAACKALKMDPVKLPDFSMLSQEEATAMTAHYKLVIIARAINEDWKPDWNDYDETKYYPWFEMSSSGFRFFGVNCVCTDSGVGSRLCFKSRDLAEYAGKTFKKLYKDYFTFQ